jgi:hypothetical protein
VSAKVCLREEKAAFSLAGLVGWAADFTSALTLSAELQAEGHTVDPVTIDANVILHVSVHEVHPLAAHPRCALLTALLLPQIDPPHDLLDSHNYAPYPDHADVITFVNSV